MTYYVAMNGKDSNPGTSAAPFATLQRGVDAAKPGDTVLVRNGTYGPGTAGNADFPVNIKTAGVTLQAENKLGAVLDCQNVCYGYIYLAAGSANIVIDGFDITRGLSSGIHANSGGAKNVVVRNCHIHHVGNRVSTDPWGLVGIYTDQYAVMTVENCEIDHIGRTNDPGNSFDHGIYYRGNLTIRGNVFHHSLSGWHIQTADGFQGSITQNTFDGQNLYPGKYGQIMLWGAASGPISISRNIFAAPGGPAVVSYQVTPAGCSISANFLTNAITNESPCTVSGSILNGNPQFVGNGDYHLQPGSAAAGYGAFPVPVSKVHTVTFAGPGGVPMKIEWTE